MKTIWKYAIDLDGATLDREFNMPIGSDVVKVGYERTSSIEQNLVFWAEVDPAAATERRTFEIFGTGHPIPDTAIYHGTTSHPTMPLVLHLYERFDREASSHSSTGGES